MVTIGELINAIKAYNPEVNEKRIRSAYEFAEKSHRNQLRKSGEPYIQHPLEAALTLTKVKVDETTIMGEILHDVPEDTTATLQEIEDLFGSEIAYLVNGVTKISKVQYKDNMEEHQIESLRKMFLVMARDLRVVLIKLADRLHNMETLDAVRPDKRRRIAKETLEIYAPLADRLGIFQFKWRLEDLCFKYLHPAEHARISKELAINREGREAYIERVISILLKELEVMGVEAKINGRTKHLFSIYQKMLKKRRTLDEIFDIFAVRVIVPSVRDCYTVLGTIHDLWRPKPGRFKDYIAIPKANGYQSMHTTVFCLDGRLTEFQIRTDQMHEEAEYGAPAHWYYSSVKKSRKTPVSVAPSDQMRWVRHLAVLNENLQDNKEFLEGLKIDLFKDRIFIFTPRGDVIDLPNESTPIDFAYAIHTDLGHSCIGAKVDGKIVPLDTELQNGCVIEILSTKIPTGPKRDWLNFVKTNSARSKIRAWLKEENREYNLLQGINILEKDLSRLIGIKKITDVKQANIERAIEALPYTNLDNILVAIGEGSITSINVIRKMFDPREIFANYTEKKKKKAKPKPKNDLEGMHVVVDGEENLEFSIGKCCHPEYPDPIVAYSTVTNGIKIHRQNCHNLIKADPKRFIRARWASDRDETEDEKFEVEIRIMGVDRVGMLRDTMTALSKLDVNICFMYANNLPNSKRFENKLRLQINSIVDLRKVFEALEKIHGIELVERI